MKKATAPDRILQLKVVLRNIQPRIWRRLLVESNRTFAHLHAVLQWSFGWRESHLHDFEVAGVRVAEPEPDFDEGAPPKNPRTTRLSDLVTGGVTRFLYRYDFGDDWEHDIEVEQVLPPDPNVRYPVCLEGARSAPPEDVGGVSGYESFLVVWRDPSDPEYAETRTWAGDRFDPERFDLDTVNSILATFRRQVRTLKK